MGARTEHVQLQHWSVALEAYVIEVISASPYLSTTVRYYLSASPRVRVNIFVVPSARSCTPVVYTAQVLASDISLLIITIAFVVLYLMFQLRSWW